MNSTLSGFGRNRRLSVLATAAAALAICASSALAVSDQKEPAPTASDPPGMNHFLGPPPAAMKTPEAQAEIAQDVAEFEQARDRRAEAEQVAARQSSRTAYQGLPAAEARALASHTFPELMLEPAWESFKAPAGYDLVRYFGADSALVEPTGDSQAPASVVQSTLPLRVADAQGNLSPTDSELVDKGTHVEVASAVVEAQFPDQLADGISIPEIDLSLEPEGAAKAAPAAVIGEDKVFWANTDTDTDFFSTPTATGVETFWQLRSERSPEQHRLQVDAAPGSTLRPSSDGRGAEVVDKAGEVTAAVEAPLAFDADGSAVPVEMEVAGDELVLSLRHRSDDWKYPIILDPAINAVDLWTWGTPCPYGGQSYPLWRWEAVGYNTSAGCNSTSGIVNYGAAAYYYTNNYAQWVWAPPADTYLERVEFYDTDLAHSDNRNPACAWHGIWSTSAGAWQSSANSCTPWSHLNRNHEVGGNGNGHNSGHDNNVAVFQLYYPNSAQRSNTSWTAVRGAQFWVSDRHAPITSAPPAARPWADDTLPGAEQSFAYAASATDQGLGVNRLAITYPLRNPPRPGEPFNYEQSRGCGGVTGCLANNGGFSHSFSYQLSQLPEGRNTVAVTAKDMVGNATTLQWYQPVDRTAPNLQAPSGNLKDESNNILTTVDYTLTATATDGSTASDTQLRSGVTKLQWYIDGVEQTDQTVSQACSTSLASCAMSNTWQIPGDSFEAGTHSIQVVATDQLGHRSVPQEFPITVRDDSDEAAVTISAGTPAVDGSYQLDVIASDGGPAGSSAPYGSGSVHSEIFVDGDLVDTFDQTCPNGGCEIHRVLPMSGSQSPADHEISAVVYDRAGNSSVAYLGRITARYPWFGYNDDIDSFRLERATAGGANVVRFPVNWCAIARDVDPNPSNPREPVPPENWDWSSADARFLLVEAKNTDRDPVTDVPIVTNDVRTIPVLLNAPAWTRDSAEPQPCEIKTPPARDTAGLESWRQFVSEFNSRYRDGGPGPDGAVLAIEAWNEPNLDDFWMGPDDYERQPGRFAELVNIAGEASDLPVLPGGLSPAPTASPQGPFLEDATASGTGIDPAKIEGISIHLYADATVRNNVAYEKVRDQYNELVNNVLPNSFAEEGRWITEIGFPSEGDSEPLGYASLKTQRQRLREAYKRFLRKPNLQSFIIHRVQDQDDAARNYGVVRKNSSAPLGQEPTNKKIYCLLAARVLTAEESSPSCTEN